MDERKLKKVFRRYILTILLCVIMAMVLTVTDGWIFHHALSDWVILVRNVIVGIGICAGMEKAYGGTFDE